MHIPLQTMSVDVARSGCSARNFFNRRLLADGMPFEEIVWILMPTAADATVN